MHIYKVGDYAHYSVGSDVYPLQIIDVSLNGKTVKAVGLNWKLKPTNNKTAYLQKQYLEDVEITGTKPEILIFKSRKGSLHKEPGKYGCTLFPEFVAYRNPSY